MKGKLKIARIYWNDASHYSAANDFDWLEKNATGTELETVGYVIRARGRDYVLAHEVDKVDGRARNTSVIPKKLITKVDYLESKNKEKRKDGRFEIPK